MKKTRFILPNAFTSMNFLLGVFSICWATGTFATKDPTLMGAYFIILCVLLDKLDGFAARLVNASSEFGAQFDSLADLIAFGLAPAFCILTTYKALAPSFFDANIPLMAVCFSVYVLCAAMRLAKYNACDSDCYHHHFSGLPSTFAGAVNAILVVFLKNKGIFANADCGTIYIPVLVMLVTGVLMVSPLFLPKLQPRKNKAFNLFQAVLIVITYVAGFMFISEKMILLEYLLVLVACYMVIGFAVGLVQRSKIIEEAAASKEE
ncbi:CDP-alcohol phosphatidyltransferase family protein [Fibrobacter sp.]|uniref:CDP-alcohol phosphatidyltransferase family protein n=1 Tax=Fibrobacter sp. TaxID=35828 RepID=UPI00388EB28F